MTTITGVLTWDETNPGWNISVKAEAQRGNTFTEAIASAKGSGLDPVPVIAEVVDHVCEELNVHPARTTITVTFDGLELLDANRRGRRF